MTKPSPLKKKPAPKKPAAPPQAAAAFEIFTGHRADRARMLRSFVDYSTPGASNSPNEGVHD